MIFELLCMMQLMTFWYAVFHYQFFNLIHPILFKLHPSLFFGWFTLQNVLCRDRNFTDNRNNWWDKENSVKFQRQSKRKVGFLCKCIQVWCSRLSFGTKSNTAISLITWVWNSFNSSKVIFFRYEMWPWVHHSQISKLLSSIFLVITLSK